MVVVVVVGLWIVEGRRRISFVFMLFFIFYWVWLWWETQKRKSDEFCKFVWDLEFSLFYGNFIFWVVKKERNHGGNWERENHTEIEKVTGGGVVLKKWTGGGPSGFLHLCFEEIMCLFYEKKNISPLPKLNGKILNLVVDLLPWLCFSLFSFPQINIFKLNVYILSKFY